jgi:hypothetical protein
MTYNGEPEEKGHYRKTLERMEIIKKFINDHGRLPKNREVRAMFELKKWAASELLMRVRNKMVVDEDTWEDLGRKIIRNILDRVENGEDPLEDALLIKMLQFYKPVKKDVDIKQGGEVIHKLVIDLSTDEDGQEADNASE